MTIDGLEHGAAGDAVLLAAVRTGDATSFAELYDRHAAAALSVARQYTNSSQDAEDVVAEAFTAVYSALQRGNGPQEAFRAYLFTVVRRVAAVRRNQGRRLEPTDDVATLEAGSVPMAGADDPALAGFERGIVARAFRSLPERWQLVLWHSEVEGLTPAQIAPLLGLSANSTAALAYRAREGLRQAYLAEHLAEPLDEGCRSVAGKLGSYVRGGLGQRDTRAVAEHLEGCLDCKALLVELGDVNHGMRAVVAPLVLGIVGLGALAKGLGIGGGLAALPLVGAGAAGAGAGGSAGGAASGGAGAGGAAAGVAGTGAAAVGGGLAGGAGGVAAGGAAAGGLGAILAAIPVGVAAAVVGGLVVVAAVVIAAVQLLGGGSTPTVGQGAPSAATSLSQQATSSPAPSAPEPQPSDSPAVTPPAVPTAPAAPAPPTAATSLVPSVVLSPADVVVDLPAGGLALAAGVDDQVLQVGVRNVGQTQADGLTAELSLPAGVTISGLVGGNLQATGGLAVPAPSWVCVPGDGAVAARCALPSLPALTGTTLVVHVSVDESYEAADGSLGLHISGAGVDVRMPSIPVQVAAAPARVAVRGLPVSASLVAGRTRTLSFEVANMGGTATSAAAPAQVHLTLPDGVTSTTAAVGPWACSTGTGDVTCTAVLPARSTSTLSLQLAAVPGTAAATGAIPVSFGPTTRSAVAQVPFSLVQPAHLTLDVPAGTQQLGLGSTADVPVQVTNTGGLASDVVTVQLALPAGAAWADPPTGAGWTCTGSGDTVSCTHDALEVGAGATLRAHLTARPGVFGPLGALAVSATSTDADADGARALELSGRAPVVGVDTSGGRLLLTEHEVGTVTFALTVADGADASGVRVTIALPAGISYDPDAAAQTPGCAAGSDARTVLCDLGVLAAGSRTQVLVHVQARGATTAQTAITVLADGGVGASGKIPVVASSGGLTPRLSLDGDVHVTQVGAPILSCGTEAGCDRIVTVGTADNNGQTMTPLDERPPTGVTRPELRAGSSTTTLAVPEGRPVLWAGLYWSANREAVDTWNTAQTSALLAGPDGRYRAVTGEVVSDVTDNSGRRYYQTFADVTDRVSALGAGQWSLADMAVAVPANAQSSASNYYAGWSLVVVYGTVAPVDSAVRSVTVYDGGDWVGTSNAAPVFDFTAEQGTAATIGVVAWEGDRTSTGDRLRLNGIALTPTTWDGRPGSSDNAFDATATGWRARNSLGVDAKAFAPVTMPSDVGTLTATTSGDQYLVGAITLEAQLPVGP